MTLWSNRIIEVRKTTGMTQQELGTANWSSIKE